MKATEFDKQFDAGEDMSAHVDWTKAGRLNVGAKRVNEDFPTWVVTGLDWQARGGSTSHAAHRPRSQVIGIAMPASLVARLWHHSRGQPRPLRVTWSVQRGEPCRLSCLTLPPAAHSP
jgi:hypothetical protein